MSLRTVDLPPRRTAAGYEDQGLVGRDQMLSLIDSRLRESAAVALTAADSALTMHGGGGIGKTALALEYCYTLAPANDYDLIWWVNADSDTTTGGSFESLVRRLGGDTDNPDVRLEVDRVLSGCGKWLAVFDNVDDRGAFDRWRPQAAGGSILITTRSKARWEPRQSIGVDLIAADDARSWLLQAAGNPDDADELGAVDELVSALGGLALALAMAAAYIGNTPVSIGTYLRLFSETPDHVLNDPSVDVGGYDKTVYTALAVALQQLRTTGQDAAVQMLEYSSFYAPDDIPLFLFTPEEVGVSSEAQVRQAMRTLAERSLVIPNGKDGFDVHRLIQSVTRHYLEHPLPEPVAETVPKPTGGLGGSSDRTVAVRKVVVIAANSLKSPLNLEEELRNIRDGLDRTGQLEAEMSLASRPDDLLRYVSDNRPVIVHFSGHGNEDGLALKDDSGQSERLVPGERLRSFFEDRGVQLVVLNSCYSEAQATVIAQSVPAVIGTPASLVDESAHRFSKAFYRTLANGRTVGEALKDGQDVVGLYDLDDQFQAHGDLDFALVSPPGNTSNPPSRPAANAQPSAAASVQPTPTPVESSSTKSGSRLERGYYVAGIVVAIVAVVGLVVSLWPDRSETTPDPAGPTTSTVPETE